MRAVAHPPRVRMGKRGRRALIRLRHMLAAEKFRRWLDEKLHVEVRLLERKRRERLWHLWHAFGCP